MNDTEDPRKPQIVIIVARQRSGTTALSETLSTSSFVYSVGEVFHDMHSKPLGGNKEILRLHPEASFFEFKADMLRRQPELAYPSVSNQTYLFDSYVDHLSNMTDKNWIAIDIKYNSWHHFEHFYSTTGYSPFLFHLLKQRNAAFIHVIRHSAFARYCSEQLALSRWKWHAEQGAAVEEASIIIDPRAALRDMVETRRLVDTFTQFLSATQRRISLRYENIYDGDRLKPETDVKITRLLDGDWTSGLPVPLQKLTPPLGKIVANRDEVLAYFDRTTFREEVTAALAVSFQEVVHSERI